MHGYWYGLVALLGILNINVDKKEFFKQVLLYVCVHLLLWLKFYFRFKMASKTSTNGTLFFRYSEGKTLMLWIRISLVQSCRVDRVRGSASL